jgi:hypothetical protein
VLWRNALNNEPLIKIMTYMAKKNKQLKLISALYFFFFFFFFNGSTALVGPGLFSVS